MNQAIYRRTIELLQYSAFTVGHSFVTEDVIWMFRSRVHEKGRSSTEIEVHT